MGAFGATGGQGEFAGEAGFDVGLPPAGTEEVRGVFSHSDTAAVERQGAMYEGEIGTVLCEHIGADARPGPRPTASVWAKANAGRVDFDEMARSQANGNEPRDRRPTDSGDLHFVALRIACGDPALMPCRHPDHDWKLSSILHEQPCLEGRSHAMLCGVWLQHPGGAQAVWVGFAPGYVGEVLRQRVALADRGGSQFFRCRLQR